MTDKECRAQLERGLRRSLDSVVGGWIPFAGEPSLQEVITHALGWLDIITKRNNRFWFHREKWMTECSRVERENRHMKLALKVAKKEVGVSVLLQEYLVALGIENVESLFSKRDEIKTSLPFPKDADLGLIRQHLHICRLLGIDCGSEKIGQEWH
jgi:hypothetical protein